MANRDNTMTASIQERFDEFRANPQDPKLYRWLRDQLRKHEQHALLGELYELRAPVETDPHKAAEYWAEAGRSWLAQKRPKRAMRALEEAVYFAPTHPYAVGALCDIYLDQRRFAETAELIEDELEELQELSDKLEPTSRQQREMVQRRAERHRVLANLWDEHLGRVDRALTHWQRAWQLEPEHIESLAAAREIYASLGDDRMVARLYESELELQGDTGAPKRRGEIQLELGRIAARQRDMNAAATHVELSLRLDAGSMPAREALADIYTSAEMANASNRSELLERAAALLVELGEYQLGQHDEDAGIEFLRRAHQAAPHLPKVTAALERGLYGAERWEALDALYIEQYQRTADLTQRMAYTGKRLRLYDEQLEDREMLETLLVEFTAQSSPHTEIWTRLREFYRDAENWAALAAHIEAGLPTLQGNRSELCDEILELAVIVREHMGNRDRAAQLLHHILVNIDPTHEEALARYSDHFRERRDWRGLADVLDFSVESAYNAGTPPSQLVPRLEEIAEIAEQRLGDIDRAIRTWNRIQEFEPSSAKPAESIRRLMSRAKMWESLVGVLEQEAQAAQHPAQRAEALRRIAQVYRERQVDPHRAITLYEEVVALFPDDRPALKALRDLYEREGDKAGLASTIRRQLDLDARAMGAVDVQRPGARDWPMAQRSERLTSLRRLMSMYERIDDTEGVVFACSGILEILPGDRDALERMEGALEKAGDTMRLVQTLEYHVASASGPAERAKILRRLARIVQQENDDIRAMDSWEKVIEAAPSDREAREKLADLYERHQRFPELASVLEKMVMPSRRGGTQTGIRRVATDNSAMKSSGRAGSEHGRVRSNTVTGQTVLTGKIPDLPTRVRELERYARVVDNELKDDRRAIRAWEQLVELDSKHVEALEALARLYQAHDQFAELAHVRDLQVTLIKHREPEKAAAMALEQTRILETQLEAPAEAIRSLEAVLHELQPGNLDAHAALSRLYRSLGDGEAAVRIAERQLYLTTDTAAKIDIGMTIALSCRDDLGDPHRALQALERVLSMDSDHRQALVAAAELYERVEDWASYNEVLKRRVELASTSDEKRELMGRVANILAERQDDPEGAFEWYRQAHQQAPDADTMANLRNAAERYDLWPQLASVYEQERSRLEAHGQRMDVRAYVAACRELANIAEHKLSDPKRAINAIYDAVSVQPHNSQLLAEAERLARESDQPALWKLFLECLDAAIAGAERTTKVTLHLHKARILEEQLADATNAFEELLQAFAWAPERDETRRLLYELAERRGEWNDVVAVESALLERATSAHAQLQILTRKANILEGKLNERVRAFRTLLVAFLLAPDNRETIEQLWRQARDIGPAYQPADRTPRSEPPAAYVHPHDSGRMRTPPPRRGSQPRGDNHQVLEIRSNKSMREDQTMDLSLGDLRAFNVKQGTDGTPMPVSGDTTEQIDLNDIEIESTVDIDVDDDDDNFEVADSTIELSIEDLMAPPGAKGSRAPKPPTAPPGLPGVSRRASAPPPIPTAPPVPPPAKAAQLPHMPVRAYDSPWDELAAAYEFLPTPNARARQHVLFRVAEIWETGAGNINRAFNTLARALDSGVDDTEARARLNRLAADHDAWDDLAELYETAAEEAKTGGRAIDLLMDVAEIHAHRGRGRQTEAIYRRVLGMRPDDNLARERLESLYRSEERWQELCACLEERTNPRLGMAAPESERPALLRELANIYHSQLGRTHDAIDALLRLRDLRPDDVEILRELGELYASIGRWSKVIAMLARVSELAEGTPAARDALRRIGAIYENDLELPERAIGAYSDLVAHWPDDTEAHEALDTLYQAHSRWQDLADILRRRAGLSRDPAERAQLLRRRATLLMERLGGFEEAAVALRHARTLTPDAPGLGEELVQALVGAGRAREAAAVLEGRIAAVQDASQGRRSGSAAGKLGDELAGLYIRLATIQADKLDDLASAKSNLERAINLVPDHPTALTTLARIIESREDPRTYAETKLREADALDDVEAKVAALMKAGFALRDRCGDVLGARDAFEQVLLVDTYHSSATWALVGLAEQGGDLERAMSVLEKRLGDADIEANERAKVKTRMAALASRAGKTAEAEGHLAEALEADPNHVAAILARTDLLAEAERWDELEMFLRMTLPDLQGAEDATLAELHRRQAVALEKLERDEDAYQLLLAADRLHRGSLLVKLALGENRYRARRWREAALHLGSLAMHVDAPKHPTEVAEGLYHAALAEIRALRPEKAKGLYERALDIKPNHAPSLHAMAEMAMEEGEHERAADLLTRQAAATEDPAERLRLFEALGDMSLETLGDFRRALMCYESAADAASPLEIKHLPLLVKLLHRQEAADEHLGAARTSERLAALATDPQEQAAHFAVAAENYLAVGDKERALAVVMRGVDADPYDLAAVNIASELLMAAKDFEQAAHILGRALSGSDAGDSEFVAARKAMLWNRLAHARRDRGDVKGAATAFEKSVKLAPDSDGAMDSRRHLLRLWKDDSTKRDTLLEFRRVIAADSMALTDVVNYARTLCRAKHDDGGRAILELAEAMGHRMGPLDIAFLERRPVYHMAADEAYRAVLPKNLYDELVLGRTRDDDSGERMAKTLAAMWEAASVLWPDPEESLERCGVVNASRVPGSSDLAAAAIFPNIVTALDLPATVLYTTDMPDAPDVQVVCVAAPVVVVGPRLQVPVGWDPDSAAPGTPSEAELRFLLARAAEMTRPEHIIPAGMPYTDFTNRMASVLRCFGPKAVHKAVATEIEDEDIQRAHDEMLRGDIPVKLRGELEELLEGASARDFDVNRYYSRLDRAADRAGLLLCGDIATAARNAGELTQDGQRVTRYVLQTALRPGYLEARAKLGVGVR